MAGLDLATRVSTRESTMGRSRSEPCSPSEPVGAAAEAAVPRGRLRFRNQAQHPAPAGARRLPRHRGSRAHVRPKTCWRSKPDGVFLSNGPGDPEPLAVQAGKVRKLIGKVPIFGICLGHQILGLAARRQNVQAEVRPSRRESSGAEQASRNKVEITSHNHGFAVDPDSLNLNDIEITHINLNDQTLEGFRHRNEPVFCVQYHPEAAPGPHDSHYLFDDFMKLIEEFKRHRQ